MQFTSQELFCLLGRLTEFLSLSVKLDVNFCCEVGLNSKAHTGLLLSCVVIKIHQHRSQTKILGQSLATVVELHLDGACSGCMIVLYQPSGAGRWHTFVAFLVDSVDQCSVVMHV